MTLPARLDAALAGRYRVTRELGRGGMAVVYLADDLRHERQVAVKVILPEVAQVLGAERFSREITIAARLNHPHILPLYDSGGADGLLFYVMPWVKGESLREKLRREGQLQVEEAVRIVCHAAGALDHAHAQGLVHRDIKPENILLHEGEAMVADFGIALAPAEWKSDRVTSSGLALGTPSYMSPEQAAGEPRLDARSDVYSLACVLYELLAGEPPYTGPTVQSIIVKRFTDPVPAIRRLRAAVPVAVEQALLRALSPVPADRFASCGEFADALVAPAAPAHREASVAVLPFQSMSTDAWGELFAEGITEDVIAQLSKIRALKVISRTSAMQFRDGAHDRRQVAARLGVTTLLEGSVRQAGERVRIVAQLVDAETERQLWAETYDRQCTDIFQIQTDVALQIAGALRAELSRDEQQRLRAEPTSDFRAYELYLQGRYWFSQYSEAGLLRGIRCFEQALELDPGYALAWTGIARAHAEFVTVQATRLTPEESIARAREAAGRALALDPGLGEAHGVMGLVKMLYDFDWAGAEAAFKLALRLSPSSADVHDHYGWLCWSTDRYDEAVDLVRRARELDPLAHRSDVAAGLLRAGRFEEAAAEARQTIASDPAFARGHSALGWALIALGDHAGGVAEMERASELAPSDPTFLGQLGQAYATVGRIAEARDILRRLETMAAGRAVSPYNFAYVHTGLGEFDRAIDLLERAYEERSGAVFGIKGSFLFVPLRGHPRFRALLRKMHLE
ncbi:MAG: protein kinase domain-containing protein [Gemmatimonadales bacterium]